MDTETGTAPAETAAQNTTEPSAAPQAPVSAPTEPVNEQPVQPAVDVEALQKELEKTKMEANLNRNKLDKIAKQQEEAKLADMDEVDRLKTQVAQMEEEKAVAEAKSFRDKVISEYGDEATQKLARALLEKNPNNLTWGDDVEDFDQAKEQLVAQLDALRDVVGQRTPVEGETPSPDINPNNPSSNPQKVSTREDAIQEAREKGDWASIIKSIPSVQQKIKELDL